MKHPDPPFHAARIRVVGRNKVQSRAHDDEPILYLAVECVRMASILERIEQIADEAVWPLESHVALAEIRVLLLGVEG